MASGTPKRVRSVESPTTDRPDASDVIGAGLESPSPVAAELEAQEVSRVKRRRLLRNTTSEAEWAALIQRGKSEVDKNMAQAWKGGGKDGWAGDEEVSCPTR